MTVLRRATPERLSAFSDGVFAVLITVLVLELRPPELPTFNALLLLWPRWLSYSVSYLFIAIVWTYHHYLMRYTTQANPRLLWFNFAHLFSNLTDRAQDHALAIDHDLVPFRGGCGCSAEISTGWTRNLCLLPDRLLEARSAGSGDPDISGIARPHGHSAYLARQLPQRTPASQDCI